MALTATLHLKRAFIAPVASPSTYVSAGTSGSIGGGGQRSEVNTREGEFRGYANGVTRLIIGSSTSREINVAFRALTPTQVALLKSMVGKTCLFRDTYGRRMYGSFLVTTETNIPMSGVANSTLLTDVGINFTEVTYVEGSSLPDGAGL